MQILLSLFAILHISSPRSLHKKHRPIHLENRPYYHTGLANLLSVAQDTRQGHKECVGCTRDPHLYLTKLGHHDAVCNDGSRAGYVLYPNLVNQHGINILCNTFKLPSRHKERVDLVTNSRHSSFRIRL